MNRGKKPPKRAENKYKCGNLDFMRAGIPAIAGKFTSLIDSDVAFASYAHDLTHYLNWNKPEL